MRAIRGSRWLDIRYDDRSTCVKFENEAISSRRNAWPKREECRTREARALHRTKFGHETLAEEEDEVAGEKGNRGHGKTNQEKHLGVQKRRFCVILLTPCEACESGYCELRGGDRK